MPHRRLALLLAVVGVVVTAWVLSRGEPHEVSPAQDREPASVKIIVRSPLDETFKMEHVFEIHGRIVDAHGDPFKHAMVYYRHADASGPPESALVDEDGNFRIWDLREGMVKLGARVANSPGARVSLDTLLQTTAPAGARGVILTVEDVGVTLDVTIEGLAIHERFLRAVLVQQAAIVPDRASGLLSGGHVVFRGLKHDARYTLWIHGGEAGWFVNQRDLIPGGAEVLVKAQQGSSIRGRLVVPQEADVSWCSVFARWVEHGYEVTGVVDEEGHFTVSGLPSGAWRLMAAVGVAAGTPAETVYYGQRIVQAGSEDVVLVMRRQ